MRGTVAPLDPSFGSRLFWLVQLVFAGSVKAWLAGASVEIPLWAVSAYFSLIGTNCQRQERSLPDHHSDIGYGAVG
jgi:hypothetical protein